MSVKIIHITKMSHRLFLWPHLPRPFPPTRLSTPPPHPCWLLTVPCPASPTSSPSPRGDLPSEALAATTKCQRPAAEQTRIVQSWAGNLWSGCRHGWFPPRALLRCGCPLLPVVTWSSLCGCLCVRMSPPYKDTRHILATSSSPDCLQRPCFQMRSQSRVRG